MENFADMQIVTVTKKKKRKKRTIINSLKLTGVPQS